MKKLLICLMVCFMLTLPQLVMAGDRASEPVPPNTTSDTTEVPMYTYDGDIDPQIFAKWEPVSYNINKDGYYHIVMFNPAKDTDIPQVDIVVYKDVIVVYGFFRSGVKYLYALDWNNNHYEQIEPKGLW